MAFGARARRPARGPRRPIARAGAFSLWPRVVVMGRIIDGSHSGNLPTGLSLSDRRSLGASLILPVVLHPSRFLFIEAGPAFHVSREWGEGTTQTQSGLHPYLSFGAWL